MDTKVLSKRVMPHNLTYIMIIVLACLLAIEPVSAKRLVDGYYDIELTYDAKTAHILVNMHIAVQSISDGDTLPFILNSKAKIDSIASTNNGIRNVTKWSCGRGDTCHIYPGSQQHSKGSDSLVIWYNMPVDTLTNGDIMLRNEERWYPRFGNMLFRYRAAITVPKRYGVIMAGDSIAGKIREECLRSIWTCSRPMVTMPIYLVIIAGTRQYVDTSASCPIEFTARTCNDSVAYAITTQCRSAITFYEKYMGSIPIKKLRMVEAPGFMAVQSLPGLMLIGQIFLDYYLYPGCHDWPVHEIAHQWIGGSIFTQRADLDSGRIFIEESLTEFMKLLYLQESYGADSVDMICQEMQKQVDSLSGSTSVSPLYKIRANTESGAIQAYKQGPLVWRRFMGMIGASQWKEFLGGLFDKYRFQPLQYRQLRDELSARTTPAAASALDSLIGYDVHH